MTAERTFTLESRTKLAMARAIWRFQPASGNHLAMAARTRSSVSVQQANKASSFARARCCVRQTHRIASHLTCGSGSPSSSTEAAANPSATKSQPKQPPTRRWPAKAARPLSDFLERQEVRSQGKQFRYVGRTNGSIGVQEPTRDHLLFGSRRWLHVRRRDRVKLGARRPGIDDHRAALGLRIRLRRRHG